MIRDLLHERPSPDLFPDVCIVGAGAAGIVLAVELSRQGRTVLLLEAGARDLDEADQELYQADLLGLPHRGISTGRFRVHGGTTRRWGGQILELDTIDLDHRPWIPESGWPLSKRELQPFYDRALVLEGLGSVVREDNEVWRAIHIKPPAFDGLIPYLSRWCPEPDFSRLYRTELEGPEIEVWLHANAVELELSDASVRGVCCRTLHGHEHLFRAREFVFCLGAIETTRFFLQPRDGQLPWNLSGRLGHHFQDHIDLDAAKVQVRDRRAFHRAFDNMYVGGHKYHAKMKLQPAVEREQETLNVAATMAFNDPADEALGGVKATARKLLHGRLREVTRAEALSGIAALPSLTRQVWRYSRHHRAYNSPDATVSLRIHCEQEPTGASRLTLSGGRDRLGMQRICLDWRISELERHSMRVFVEQAQRSFRGLLDLAPDPALLAGDPAIDRRCDDSNHHIGGMRMAASPQQGVVDTDLRLHGLHNCFACTSAVFPTGGFSNPTHTVLALAVRLADRLARQLEGA